MNGMVEKIVSLLFADIEENEETRDLREEIGNNCQERYADLMANGYSEDEALDAVVESLRGMEEVLAPYRRRQEEPGRSGFGEADARAADIDLNGLERLRADLSSFDLQVEESDTDSVEMKISGEGSERISLRREGSTLLLRESHISYTKTANLNRVKDWGSFMREIGNAFNDFRHDVRGGSITLLLPRTLCLEVEINSASGDIAWRQLDAKKLSLTSASGDIEVEAVQAERLGAKSNSGDVEVDCDAEYIDLNSLSGDVTWEGQCQRIKLRTVSGDIELRGAWLEAEMSTVSGDADVALGSRDARLLTVNSTSGDIRVRLPEGLAADVQAHTVYGDVSYNVNPGISPTLTIRAHTMSGDIRVK